MWYGLQYQNHQLNSRNARYYYLPGIYQRMYAAQYTDNMVIVRVVDSCNRYNRDTNNPLKLIPITKHFVKMRLTVFAVALTAVVQLHLCSQQCQARTIRTTAT